MVDITGEKPWVAFCMSTYKRPGFLKRQLLSLQKQTYTNFEVIVSDNDPEQSARRIVAEINDDRFKYYPNGENLGMVKSFNQSILRTNAEYIVMITDDDPANNNMLQVLYGLTISHPGYGMYFGGNDRFYATVDSAKLSNARVGNNTQLADLDEGTIRIFSPSTFPAAYLNEDFGGGIFWSVGIVNRNIILEYGGLPDYGSPNMMDCAYVLLSGSKQGAVFINTSLGTQSIHQDNYSFKNANYEHFSKGVSGFYEVVKNKLPDNIYNAELDKQLRNYTARTTLSLLIFAKKNMRKNNTRNESFEKCMSDIFQIPFMKKWKLKYNMAVYTPFLFNILISIKKNLIK